MEVSIGDGIGVFGLSFGLAIGACGFFAWRAVAEVVQMLDNADARAHERKSKDSG